MGTVQRDLDAAVQFVSAIAGTEPVCFQIFKDFETAPTVPKWKYGTFSELRPWLIEENETGAGIYMVVNQGDGTGRSKENITKVRALFVDLDGAPLEHLRRSEVLPSIVIESSPGRYHGYWLVTDCPLDEFTPMQSALAHKFNGDGAVKDLPRVMRIPGFVHNKKVPFVSKILHCDTDKKYQLKTLLDLMQLASVEQDPKAILLQDSFRIQKGERHQKVLTVAGKLRNSGLSGVSMLSALNSWNRQHCTPPLPDKDIDNIAKWICKKEGAIPPNYKTDYRPSTVNLNDTKALFDKSRTFRQLEETKMDSVRWIIEGVLPEGLAILGGRPKVGKSWLTQAWCLAVSQGHDVMAQFNSVKGKTLSLSLEDSDRRFRDRLLTLKRDDLDTNKPAPDNAYFLNEWPRMPKAAEMLREWLDMHGDTNLIVIDTLARIQTQAKGKGGNAYYSEYDDIGALQSICQEYRIAIVVVHHLRKGESDDDIESVSGTTGITGAADTVMLLRRPDRSTRGGKLIIHGRDIADKYYDLTFQENNGLWVCTGSTKDTGNMNDLAIRVISVMQDGKPRSRPDIARDVFHTDDIEWKHRKNIERVVAELAEKEVISQSAGARGKFVLMSAGAGAIDYATTPDSVLKDLPSRESSNDW